MKIVYTRSPGCIKITKEYEPGEKYISSLRWNRADGKATKELVESMIPDCTFIKVWYERGRSFPNLDWVTTTYILVDRTFWS